METLTKEEYKKLKETTLKDLWKSNCPFCDFKTQWDRVVWKGKFLYITHALCPYMWMKDHLMIIPYLHRKYTYDMTKQEFWELKEAELFIKNYYWDKHYFSFIRETMWDRSLEHLHYHFLPWSVHSCLDWWDLNNEGYLLGINLK